MCVRRESPGRARAYTGRRNLDRAASTLNTTPRTPRPVLGALLASAVVLAVAPAPARADSAPRIFPLEATSPLPPNLADAAEGLTDALVALLDGVTTDRSLADFGKKLRCDIEVSTCLDAVARSLVTTQLVYGTFEAAPGGKLKVKLVRFDSAPQGSEMFRRTITLTAQTPKRLGKQLGQLAAVMFDMPAPVEPVGTPSGLGPRTEERTEPVDRTEPREPREPAEPREPTPPPGETIVLDDPPAGRITKGTWGLIGGGALGAAVGAGFLLSTGSLERLVATAPRETVADFRRLTEIERAGRIRTQVGGTLLVVGGAVLATGIVRAVLQRGAGGGGESSDARDGKGSLERSLSLVPVEGGGAAIVLFGGLR